MKRFLLSVIVLFSFFFAESQSVAREWNEEVLNAIRNDFARPTVHARNLFHTSLANPVRTGPNDRTYGMIYIADMSITTSGNYEQYALYEGLRYHHIVSPLTKMPEHYYYTITVLGDDAGALDAISTALFSMPPNVLDSWINENLEDLAIEIIIFNYDKTIDTYLDSTEFKEN